MAEAATKLTVHTTPESEPAPATERERGPLASLRRSIDRLFDDFDVGFFPALRQRFLDIEPFRSDEFISAPAADLTETDNFYELSMELPGMDESNVDVTVAGRVVTISGEKREDKEEERKDYYLSERRYGSFKRSFRAPEGVDTDKIEANFAKGVLKVTLPKTPEAQRPVKKVDVKGAR